jgi:hypothetical protein
MANNTYYTALSNKQCFNVKIKLQKSKLQIKIQKFKNKLFYDRFNILNFTLSF